jgi:hypothetical protein
VRRETASGYLKEAGIVLRPPGNWGRAAPKPAIEVITDSGGGKPFSAGDDDPACAKPANMVTTDFGAELAASASTAVEPKPGRSPSASVCAPYRDTIEVGLSRGRNAMAFRRGAALQILYEAPHALITGVEAAEVHQVLPDDRSRCCFRWASDTTALDTQLTAALQQLARKRGQFAHASFKAHQPIDPRTERDNIQKNIFPELKKLDRRLTDLA